jgi:hypothetical protein
MHYLTSVYSVTIPLHVLGLLVAHHQEVTMYRVIQNDCQGFNPFAYTYGWEPVWATDVFAFSSSFLSVDAWHVIYRFKTEKKKAYFEWCIKILIVSIFGYKLICTA